MTKKDFKERCSFHTYTRGREKHNAIFFDWQNTDQGRGFKFAVAVSRENSTKKDLLNDLYNWVILFFPFFQGCFFSRDYCAYRRYLGDGNVITVWLQNNFAVGHDTPFAYCNRGT